MNIKMIIYVALAVAVLLSASWVYGLWKDYQQLKFEHSMTLQNKQALEDSLNVKADSITVLAASVRDLQSENSELNSKNIALAVRNRILVDSLHARGDTVATISGDTVRVPFSGKKGIFSFEGWTEAYISTKVSKWSLEGSFDSILVDSKLYKDSKSGLWVIRTESRTPSVKVRGESVLDKQTYAALQEFSPSTPPKSFGLNIQANTVDFWGGLIFRYSDQWYLNLNYRLTNHDPSWSKNVLVGVSGFLF